MIPNILTAKVMHNRIAPKKNKFSYNIYYLVLPLSQLYQTQLRSILNVNTAGFVSFHEKDHGAMDGSSIESWIRNILSKFAFNKIITEIVLVAMPRVLNYCFNPVSFWLCLDGNKNIRAVLCEVKNTFGESHNYLCAHMDKRIIQADDWLIAEKVFHVSPFLPRKGTYQFNFSIKQKILKIVINYHDDKEKKQLITSVIGCLTPLTKSSIRRAIWCYPFVTLKTVFLIHLQALKLLVKGVRYISKPVQKNISLSSTSKFRKI